MQENEKSDSTFVQIEKWFGRLQNLYSLMTFPLIASAIVILTGYFQGVALMWLLLAGIVALSYTTWTLLNFSRWRDYNDIEHKLAVSSLFCNFDCNWDKTGKPIGLALFNVGCNFVNSSNHTMLVEFEEFRVFVDNIVANDPSILNGSIVLQCGQTSNMRQTALDLAARKSLQAKGTVEISINYKRPKKTKKYTLKKKFSFEFLGNKEQSQRPILFHSFSFY